MRPRGCVLCGDPACKRVIGEYGIETPYCQAWWEAQPSVQEKGKASWDRVMKKMAENRLERFKEGRLRYYERDWKPEEEVRQNEPPAGETNKEESEAK